MSGPPDGLWNWGLSSGLPVAMHCGVTCRHMSNGSHLFAVNRGNIKLHDAAAVGTEQNPFSIG